MSEPEGSLDRKGWWRGTYRLEAYWNGSVFVGDDVRPDQALMRSPFGSYSGSSTTAAAIHSPKTSTSTVVPAAASSAERVRVGDARTEGVADPARGHARHDVVAGTYRFVAKCRRAGIGQHEADEATPRALGACALERLPARRSFCPTRRRTPGRPRAASRRGSWTPGPGSASPVEGESIARYPAGTIPCGVPASSNVSHNAAPNSEGA